MLGRRAATLLAICVGLAGCGGGGAATSRTTHAPTTTAATATTHATRRAAPANWTGRMHVLRVLDLAGPRADGSFVVATNGRLAILARDGSLRRFAPGYSAPKGLEAYIAPSSGQRAGGCRWPPGNVYALRLAHGHGVTVVDPRGHVRKFAAIATNGLLDGIAFDTVGRFGHRLLVTSTRGSPTSAKRTALYAIGCDGRVQMLTHDGPRVEGGMVVAPRSFGRFGGDLLVPDEIAGNLYAFAPDGRASLVVRSGIAHGQDVGIESLGLVPTRYGEALVSDRRVPGNPHPGDDLILGISHARLRAAGVRAGDLVAAGEGGAGTVAISCASTCRSRAIGAGPRIAHVEGHVVFTRPGAGGP